MAGSSLKQFYESINPFDLRTDMPCDASRVWTLFDNIKHLCDSQPKYIVNVAGSPSAMQYFSEPAVPAPFGGWLSVINLTFTFPSTTLQRQRFCNYDVLLSASVTDGTLNAKVAIGNANASWPPDGNDSNVVGTLTGTSSSTTPAIVINGQIIQFKPNVTMTPGSTTVQSVATGHLGQSMNSNLFYGKVFVQLQCVGGFPSSCIRLDQLSIREYTP